MKQTSNEHNHAINGLIRTHSHLFTFWIAVPSVCARAFSRFPYLRSYYCLDLFACVVGGFYRGSFCAMLHVLPVEHYNGCLLFFILPIGAALLLCPLPVGPGVSLSEAASPRKPVNYSHFVCNYYIWQWARGAFLLVCVCAPEPQFRSDNTIAIFPIHSPHTVSPANNNSNTAHTEWRIAVRVNINNHANYTTMAGI